MNELDRKIVNAELKHAKIEISIIASITAILLMLGTPAVMSYFGQRTIEVEVTRESDWFPIYSETNRTILLNNENRAYVLEDFVNFSIFARNKTFDLLVVAKRDFSEDQYTGEIRNLTDFWVSGLDPEYTTVIIQFRNEYNYTVIDIHGFVRHWMQSGIRYNETIPILDPKFASSAVIVYILGIYGGSSIAIIHVIKKRRERYARGNEIE